METTAASGGEVAGESGETCAVGGAACPHHKRLWRIAVVLIGTGAVLAVASVLCTVLTGK